MFKKMRKSHMKMNEKDMMKILKEGEYGIVSTVGKDGYPYGFPMSYILMDGSIYFHCGIVGHKIDNINYSNKVSFTVVGKTELLPEILDTNYESIVLFGRARKVEGEEKIRALEEIVDKYAKGFMLKGKASIDDEKDITLVIKIEIEDITGKIRWGDIR